MRQQHSAPDDGRHSESADRYDVHRIADGAPRPQHSPSSVASNVSVSSYESATRQRQQRAIASAFFGPSSQATDVFFETDQEDVDAHASFHDYYSHSSDDDDESVGNAHPSSSRRASTGNDSSSTSKKRGSRATVSSASSVQPLLHSVSEQSGEQSERASITSAEEAAVRRRRRKENQEKFKQLARLADARRPVNLNTFMRKSTRELTRQLSSRRHHSSGGGGDDGDDGAAAVPDKAERRINTELLEAYVMYARSIGHEPQIDIFEHRGSSDSDQEGVNLVTGRASFIQQRIPVVKEHTHPWTDALGTRHSKRRGCLQFWGWLCIGVIVSIIMAFFLAHLSLNEVLHLDAFVKDNVVVKDDFTFLYLRDEVTFRLKYDIESEFQGTVPGNESFFQVMLLYEDEFEAYVDGEPFEYIAEGSTLRTTYASLPLTTIENHEHEEIYFVVQPCVLPWNPSADYCQTKQLPTPIDKGRKVYKLKKSDADTAANSIRLAIRHLYVNPMPNTCSDSGWQGGWYLLIFLPYVVLALFGLRVFQMAFRCESFRANLERKYQSEFDVPENEVDYWQPMPWDRKVPKTRLLGPCCWKKMRKPFEPFYTWWRHENYFTWIFCPYRNERLSRGERAIIVFCSLYLTFYVLFVLVMLRDAIGSSMSIFASVLIYYVLIMLLPSLGKAIFKEIFKLIFRQRRKYFRVKAAGGDTEGFSFRLAFFLQMLVAVLITFTQLPMFYIWLYRSCVFLKQFMYFGLLAAVTRLSILGLLQDYVWYLVIKTWGWRDLCPYCTERLVHCDCFNDELLVLSVERVGPKWELIMLLDGVLAKQDGYTSQFDQYSPEQLRERWQILVDRAEAHMEKVEKLRAYQEKKRMDKMRRERQRASFLNATSFLSFRDATSNGNAIRDNGGASVPEALDAMSGESGHESVKRKPHHHHHHHHHHKQQQQMQQNESNTEEEEERGAFDSVQHQESDLSAIGGCCLREKKVLELNSKIELDKFEKHYDSTIVDVFHSIQSALSKRRRHGGRTREQRREERNKQREEHRRFRREGGVLSSDDLLDASDAEGYRDTQVGEDGDTTTTVPATSSGDSSSGSNGETMLIFDSPRERLERRELEKQRRKRAFRVLDNYFIETVEPERDAQGNLVYVPSSTAGGATSQAAPVSGASAGQAVGAAAALAPARPRLARKDSKYVQLLAKKKKTPREEDIVIVVSDSTVPDVHVTVSEIDDSSDSDSDADVAVGRGARASGYESSSSTSSTAMDAGAAASVPAPPPSRAYAVVERKPSLLRKASTSANSFASWIFKYDKNAEA